MPPSRSLAVLAKAASGCRACPLWEGATQTVFGEGPRDAVAMLVGEQPGNVEDRIGRPFTGPSGSVLDEVLEEVGLERGRLYLTNVVKHFKNETRGGRARIHAKPTRNEVRACRGWLDAELEAVRPTHLVALGATAAQAFMGSAFRITRERGRVFKTPFAPWWMATWHPSALLRMPEKADRVLARRQFTDDLRRLAEHVARGAGVEEGWGASP